MLIIILIDLIRILCEKEDVLNLVQVISNQSHYVGMITWVKLIPKKKPPQGGCWAYIFS